MLVSHIPARVDQMDGLCAFWMRVTHLALARSFSAYTMADSARGRGGFGRGRGERGRGRRGPRRGGRKDEEKEW